MFGSGPRLGVGFVNPASPGWGLGWVCLGIVCVVVPLVSAVCGVRGWGSVSACFWDVCGCVGAPLAPRRFRFWRAVWACVLGPGLGCAQPFLAGLSGCVFCAFFFGFPCPGPYGPCPPIPFLSGWVAGSFFFRGVCLLVSVSLLPVGRCSWLGVAGFGWVVPLCLFGGPVFGAFWGGGLAASGGVGGRFGGCGLFSRPSPSPLCCFFLGGGVCLFLPLPSLGWRTHWPAFSVVFRAAVVSCVLFGRVPAPWVGWGMYTVGSAPLLAGLGPGSAGWTAAPGGCLWLWVRGLGLFVSFPLCGAGFNLLGGPPLLLPGALWPLCVACGAGAWRAGAAPSRVCGGLLRLVPQVRVSCVVVCRSVPRRIAWCCGVLQRGALWCGVLWSRVVPRWVSGGQPGLCRGAECGPECGWLVAGGCG